MRAHLASDTAPLTSSMGRPRIGHEYAGAERNSNRRSVGLSRFDDAPDERIIEEQTSPDPREAGDDVVGVRQASLQQGQAGSSVCRFELEAEVFTNQSAAFEDRGGTCAGAR